jgi:hypothetical protein
MSKIKALFWFLPLISVCIGLPLMGKSEKKSVKITVIDLSGSTFSKEIRTAYSSFFRAVYNDLRAGDFIFSLWITGRSDHELGIPLAIRVPKSPSTWDVNPLDKKKTVDGEGYMRKLEEALFSEKSRSKNTSILGSLRLADQILEKFPDSQKTVYIFSDMIEQTELYDFSNTDLNETTIENIVKSEKKDRGLQNFYRTIIYVAGAGNSVLSLSEAQKGKIERFWKEYFKSFGSILRQYGGPLIQIPDSN